MSLFGRRRKGDESSVLQIYIGRVPGIWRLLHGSAPLDEHAMDCGVLSFVRDHSFVWSDATTGPDGRPGNSLFLASGRWDIGQLDGNGNPILVLSEFEQPGSSIPEPEEGETREEILAMTGQPSVFVPLFERLALVHAQCDDRRLVGIEPLGEHRNFTLHRVS